MDSTRISIARVLALDVPLSWQDAVAIMREVAVLAEMNAAWNDQPSLVRADRCFITTEGMVELPDTTERDTPADLVALLGQILRGRGAPEHIAALAGRRLQPDLSGALTAIPVGDRHALIAAVATRALAAERGEPLPAAVPPPVAIVADGTPAETQPATPDDADAADAAEAALEADAAAEPADVVMPLAPPRPVVVPLRAARATAPVAAWTPDSDPAVDDAASEPASIAARAATPMPRVIRPPFVAAPMMTSRASALPAASSALPDEHASRELDRLRQKTAATPPASSPALRRLLPWIYWRPDGVDPRVVGGAALVLSATVAFIIGTAPRPESATPAAPSAASAPAPRRAAPPSLADGGAAASITAGGTAAGPSTAVGAPAVVAVPLPAATSVRAAGSRATPSPAAPAGINRRASGDRPGAATVEPPPAAPPAMAPGASPPASTWVEGGGRPPVAGETRPPRARPVDAARPGADAALSRWLPPSRAPLYSVSDSGVTPPVMRRQQLPSMLLEPRTTVPDDWPFLELVIDERGAVEAVRLRAVTVAPGQTLYRQRMLLAAAKAWQFDPATRDGVPVRFLMRVPLEP